jgi:hypothetical protein
VRSGIAFLSLAGAAFGSTGQALAFRGPLGRPVLDSDIRALFLARTGNQFHGRPAVSRGQEGGQNLKEARIGIAALRVDDFEAFLAEASHAVQPFDMAAQLLEVRKDARRA